MYEVPDAIIERMESDETIVWEGKPKKSAFVWQDAIIMIPVALFAAAFPTVIIILILSHGGGFEWSFLIIIPFFGPTWHILHKLYACHEAWGVTHFVATECRIIIQRKHKQVICYDVPYSEIKEASLFIDDRDKMFNVGSIVIQTHHAIIPMKTSRRLGSSTQILDVEHPEEVFEVVLAAYNDYQAASQQG
jgi:hypothetical protein